MKTRGFYKLTGMVIILILIISGLMHDHSIVAAQQNMDKIEGGLLEQFSAQDSADFIVSFAEQADLSAAYSLDWITRGEFVYNSLNDISVRTQANAKQTLAANGIKYQTFIAGNELYVWEGDLTLASELVVLPEVLFIHAARTFYIDPIGQEKPIENLFWVGDLLATHAQTTVGSSTNAITAWGITDIKADQFWTAYGVRGEGMVVANIDTGVQWNHPALDQSFKCGGNPTDPACWNDPAIVCGGSACDNNGHGTHTMATMVGDDDPSLTYLSGVAPSAQWIACKGCETNSCSEFSLSACADWILAPNGNPSNRPNIVNNSWGGGSSNDWYLTKVNAWRAAGIFPAFSAGNTGPNCSTIGSPGDYQASFASAAHDVSRGIASFSSRGPSVFGHEPFTKPNLSAPGVSICSAIPTNSWSCGYSGTSMASPHTAGAVALLWSCNPALIGQIDATFQLLQTNANASPAGNCGAPPDSQGNYTYGYGFLDVLAAGGDACGQPADTWTQIALPPGCPDWTRFDGEYDPGTGKVYFLGGRSGTTTDGTIYLYNPGANTCSSTGKIMPTPISNYSIARLNNGIANLLCTFGGRDAAGGQTLSVQCYNPATNAVSIVTSLPAAWTGYVPGAVVVLNNKAYLLGGFNPNGPTYVTSRTDEYNPITNAFSQKGNLNLARSYIMAAAVNGKIYAFGGDTYDVNLVAQSIAEAFDPATGLWNDAAVADLPIAAGEGTAYGFDGDNLYRIKGKIIIAGGGQFPSETSEVFFYDVASNTYDYGFANLKIQRRNQAGFFMPGNPGKLWVFGGRSGADVPPYASPEFYSVDLARVTDRVFLPLALKR